MALIIAFTGACIWKESPLAPIQLLWVNLIMDALASLALATELPDREALLNRPPYSKDDSLITPKMRKNIILMALAQCAIVFILLLFGEDFIPEAEGYEP